MDPVFGQEVAEFVGRVLAAVVGTQALDVLARLVLGSRLEALEGSEDVTLAGERLDPEHARVVVDKRDDVAATTIRRYVDREHVRVHELEKLCRLTIRPRKRQPGTVREMTCIARARLPTSLSSYFQTLDMFRPGKRLQRPKGKVRKATVPGGQFRFRSSTCGKESGRTFGRARSNQLAVELVEVLPEASASGDHDAVAREGGSLSEGCRDAVVVVELRRRDEVCCDPGHEKRLMDDHDPAADELDKERAYAGDHEPVLGTGDATDG